MMSSFSFLAGEWPFLALICSQAEKNLYSDSNTTLSKLRLLAEKITDLIIAYEKIYTDEQSTQNDKLRILKRENILPSEILDLFHVIKKLGNKAIHEGHDSFHDASDALEMSFHIASWFQEAYGNDSTFSMEQQTYQKPDNVDYEFELSELKSKFSLLENELQSYKSKPSNNKSSFERLTIAKKLSLSEAETRQVIDAQLREAGWEVDTHNIKFQTTKPESGKNKAIAEWPIGTKRADYALFKGLKLIGIVEAKKVSVDVPSNLYQASFYSKNIEKIDNDEFCGIWGKYKVPFMFATNGRDYNHQLETKSGIWFLDGRESTNLPKALKGWYSPYELEEMLSSSESESKEKLSREPFEYLQDKSGLGLRDYQVAAIKSAESAIEDGRKSMLLAMATGTGKTRTVIGLIYRLIKSKRFRRILFVVDRESLGTQAHDAFKDAKIEDFHNFTKIYDVKGLDYKIPETDTKVHVATIQGLVRRVLYSDDSKYPKPSVGQYDCIIIDEAHRGYLLDKEMSDAELDFKDQMDYLSKYRTVAEYFEAVKIGLTATPALHTVQIFGQPIFQYTYRQAVLDGYLVDHDVPYIINTELKDKGIHWQKGEAVKVYDNKEQDIKEINILADDIDIDVDGFNRKVLTKEFNRAVVDGLLQYIDPTEEGKTLIFAVNNNHADILVETFNKKLQELGYDISHDTVMKITGAIYKQDQAIKRFKNEREPNIVVTVDLLTTGIDVPEIVNLVFLRTVNSRILYEQMLGRATRLCDRIGKDHFNIFDAVDIYKTLKNISTMKPVSANPSATFVELIDELDQITRTDVKENQTSQIIAKLYRKKPLIKTEESEKAVKDRTGGKTITEYIEELKSLSLEAKIEKIQKDKTFFKFLDNESFRPNFVFISEHEDKLTNVTRGFGKNNTKPDDYLESFRSYIIENKDKLAALSILCTNPQEMTRRDLKDLILKLDEEGYTLKSLNTAYSELNHADILADIISFVRNAALGEPLISHGERIRKAMTEFRKISDWTPRQKKWIDRIEMQLTAEYIITKEDFEKEPMKQHGGLKVAERDFEGNLDEILKKLNEYLYAAA